MKRLFVAVNMSSQVNAELARVSRDDFGGEINWVKPENLHITLKFLGPTATEKLPRIIEAIATAGALLPLQIGAKGAGVFPDKHYTKVLWIGINEPSGKLSAMARSLDEGLAGLDVPRALHEYSPHLTIGRVRHGNPGARFLAAYSQSDFGKSLVSELVLYESETLPTGPRYTALFVHKTP